MPVLKPYHRCVRPWPDGSYTSGGRSGYVRHPSYAKNPEYLIRAFMLLQEDLQRLFEYVEPADTNSSVYSYRCLELLIRACGEAEANFRAVLEANGDMREKKTMVQYKKLEKTHRLSSYRVKLPYWTGTRRVRCPFECFARNQSPEWFKAHHGAKHNREREFSSANLDNAVDAVSSVLVLLSSQFATDDFGPGPVYLALSDGRRTDGFEPAIGGYFSVSFPDDWPDSDCYSFEWKDLEEERSPFQKLF